jgi:hypothetical protein
MARARIQPQTGERVARLTLILVALSGGCTCTGRPSSGPIQEGTGGGTGGAGGTSTGGGGAGGAATGGMAGGGATGGAGDASTGGAGGAGGVAAGMPAFPLAVAPNGRYLVDQKGVPFRIQGDSSWSLIANLTASEVDTYLADRKARGFTAVLVNLLEHKFAVQAPRNRAGDYPFKVHAAGNYDFSIPDEAYFAFADTVLDKVRAAGMAVFLSIMYSGNGGGDEGWWRELTNGNNTRATCAAYGRFLGNRWKDRDNIIWVFSGDYTPPAGSEGEARLLAIHQALRDAGARQPAVAHNSPGSHSTSWTAFRPFLQLDGVYFQSSPAIQQESRKAYGQTPPLPAFLLEPGYEDEKWVPGDPSSVRLYEWSAQLSSTAGVFYGQRDIWEFNTDQWSSGFPFGARRWQLSLETPGSVAMRHMAELLGALPWHALVPSGLGGMKTLVTEGGGSEGSADYVSAAATPDGRALLAYLPPAGAIDRHIGVDLSVMHGPSVARWWDPSSGTSAPAGEALPNTGPRSFTVPGKNAAGATDWVLVLTAP